ELVIDSVYRRKVYMHLEFIGPLKRGGREGINSKHLRRRIVVTMAHLNPPIPVLRHVFLELRSMGFGCLLPKRTLVNVFPSIKPCLLLQSLVAHLSDASFHLDALGIIVNAVQ